MTAASEDRRHAPATARNRGPILEVLARVLPRAGTALEVASGTGEHAAWFAPRLPTIVWQPSDPDPEMRASIAAYVADAGLPNLRPPLALDVTEPDWPDAARAALGGTRPTAAIAINMIHIAPWAAAEGLISGARRLLPTDGILYLYGPFSIAGKHTAPSNAAFDRSLRARNPAWGVRDLDAVSALAADQGFATPEQVAMPANNLSVVFRRL